MPFESDADVRTAGGRGQLLSCLFLLLEVSLIPGLLPESLLPIVSVITSPILLDLPVSNDYIGNIQII